MDDVEEAENRSWLRHPLTVTVFGGILVALATALISGVFRSGGDGSQQSQFISGKAAVSEAPVEIKLEKNHSIYADGFSMVMPGKMPSSSTWPDPGSSCDAMHDWAVDRGGVDAGATYLQLTLTGRDAKPVVVNNVRLRTVPQGTASDWTVVSCPSGGSHDAIGLGFDLAQPHPVARRLGEDYELLRPYFGSKYVTVARNETVRFDLFVQATPEDVYAWTVELFLTVDGKQQIRQLDAGHDFRTGPFPSQPAESWEWAWYQQPATFVLTPS